MGKQKKLSWVMALALIVSIFPSLPSSSLDFGVVEKTVTVTDALGQPYEGASVAIVHQDRLTGFWSTSTVVISNASGVANLMVSSSQLYMGIAIAPSSSDSVHALGFLDSRSAYESQQINFYPWDQEFEYQLSLADAFVRPQLPDGSDAPPATRLSVDTYYGAALVIPYSGVFGLDFPDYFESDGFLEVKVIPSEEGFGVAESIFTPGNDQTGVIGPTPKVAGTNYFALPLSPTNTLVELLGSDGSPLTLPAEVSARVRLIEADRDSPDNYLAYPATSPDSGGLLLSDNGQTLGQVYARNLPSEQNDRKPYIPQVFLTGSVDYPSFLADTTWIDRDGQFYDSESGGSPNSRLQISLTAASPNLVVRNVQRNTDVPDPAFIELNPQNPFPNLWWGGNFSANGIAAYVIPSIGDYSLNTKPVAQGREVGSYRLTLTQTQLSLSKLNFPDTWIYNNYEVTNSATAPFGAFTISGRVLDDLKIVAVHPLTGEFLESEQIQLMVQFQKTQNSGYGYSINPGPEGFFSIDMPESGGYYDGVPVKISIEPAQSSSLDPLLAKREYEAELVNGAWEISLNGSQLAPIPNDLDADTFGLELGYSNVYGTLVAPDGSSISPSINGQWINGRTEVFNPTYDRWQPVSEGYFTVDRNGTFGVELPLGEDYRLIFSPTGFEGLASTTTPSFSLSVQNSTKVFSPFTLSAPLFLVSVTEPGSSVELTYSSVVVSSASAGIHEWFNTGQNARASLDLAAGTYLLEVRSNGDMTEYAPKKYVLTVSGSENVGYEVGVSYNGVEISPVAGTNPPRFQLSLANPNLSGRLFDPTGTELIQYTTVVPVDPATSRELWDYSAQVNRDGQWSMNLPTGFYDLYARAPWGVTEFGNSDYIQGIAIDAQGAVVTSSLPVGASANSLDIRLQYPQWSGTVVDPISLEGMADVQICLFGVEASVCTTTNAFGNWSMSKPRGFSGFGNGSEVLIRQISDGTYPERRLRGAAEIESEFGTFDPQVRRSNIVLSFEIPNLTLRVMAGTEPVRNAWVNIDRPGVWLGGANTDGNGYARFNIEDPTEEFSARADVGHLSDVQSRFTSTQRDFDLDSSNLIGQTYTATLSLQVPNFSAIVKSPDGQNIMPSSWVEVFDEFGSWLSGTSAGADGKVYLSLATSSQRVDYSLRVNPPWESNSFAKSAFEVSVATDGTISVDRNGVAVPVDGSAYVLKLSNPSVFGKVIEPTSPAVAVRDSWVTAYDAIAQEYLWQDSVHSKQDGSFAMNLADGVYELTAGVPWYLRGLYAKSDRCQVVVTTAVMAIGTEDCEDDDGNLAIRLNEPNFELTFMATVSGQLRPVPFASVGASIGDYHVYAQSDLNGRVALYLDEEAMKASADRYRSQGWLSDSDPNNPGLQAAINFWFDPPWGSSELVRWDCRSGEMDEPVCSNLAIRSLTYDSGTWSNWVAPGDIGTVNFKTPNTQVTVLMPDGVTPVSQGAWISLMKTRPQDQGGWDEWIGGGSTDGNGRVSFNIDASDYGATFSLQINAPWDGRANLPSRNISGLRLNTESTPYFNFVGMGNPTIKFVDKNLLLTVNQAKNNVSDPDKVAKYAWVEIQKYDSSSGTYSWINGNSTNQKGKAAIFLEPLQGVLYKLTVHPGSGTKGIRFSCYLDSDVAQERLVSGSTNPESADGVGGCGNPDISGNLTINLALGNTRGRVVDISSSPIAGAVVLAEASDGTAPVYTSTNATGEFFMNLESSAGRTWTLKVLYANAADTDPFLKRRKPSAGDADTRDDVLNINLDGATAVIKLGTTALTDNTITLYRKLQAS